MRKTKALIAGFFAGMASPINLFQPREYKRLQGDDLERLRGDIDRIGADFAKAIGRHEQANQPTATKRQARA